MSSGYESVRKDFTRLDEDVKREFKGVRSEVRESKIEVIKDSSVKLERVTELANFCQNLDFKFGEGFTQLNQRLKKYVPVTELEKVNSRFEKYAPLENLTEMESRVRPLLS